MTQEEKDDAIVAELENFYYGQHHSEKEFEKQMQQTHEKIQAIKTRSLSDKNNKRA